MAKKSKDDLQNDFGSKEDRRRKDISATRTATLSRRRFLGGMGAAAVAAAVGCKERSPSGVDVDAGPDVHEDGGVDLDGGPHIVEDAGQDGGPVVVEDGGQNGGGEGPDLSILRAFPGAEGSGAQTVGGRDGEVIYVTNTNDSGPGSLRAAIEAEGPRIVVFRVGGTITLDWHLWITNPFVTIAGQTAPGGGIQVRMASEPIPRSVFTVSAGEIIMRYLRVRKGDNNEQSNDISVTDTAGISCHNMIFDHLSLQWAQDKNWGLWARGDSSRAPRKITVQNCIMADMIARPGSATTRTNVITGGTTASTALAAADIDFHHNLISHFTHRGPLLKHASGRFVNNLIFDWTSWSTRTSGGVHCDVIGNVWKPGPSPKTSSNADWDFVIVDQNGHARESRPSRDPSIYIAGNRGLRSNGMNPDTDNQPFIRAALGTHESGSNSDNNSDLTVVPSHFWRSDPLPDPFMQITTQHADEIEGVILPDVGASRRLNSEGFLTGARDILDQKYVANYIENIGQISLDQSDAGDWPNLSSGTPYPCEAEDGIADAWKQRNDLVVDRRYNARRLPDGTVLAAEEGPVINAPWNQELGWTYLDLFLAGIDLPT